ncbi:trimeric intracellular cation channel family protein [Thermoflavimicrobium dichotomicum]|uniref:Uncharacterized membrane protein YeiH n=1 Tax=Thermoflavimicrobium dichotomicum TaxID=46223 RepID=A0A1I3RLN2_9BACL|nr:trimeric intracellular cation channel family protein [Thermoflavimicrobium dichotomicum]SFJ46772.1 Uncharacterized membrane protein YeiH [Thermoflavimicrobium dichotomicum]
MIWDVLNVIGTIAFAVSGAMVAMEEKYDIFGMYVLGLVTAFGGGVIRNILIGIPVTTLWQQELLIYTALLAITLIAVIPSKWMKYWRKWINLFDAIGLSTFSIQGALYAVQLHQPIVAVIIASVLPGIGGGVIRDTLAGRKPIVFQKEIYAFWSILIGIVIGLKWFQQDWELYLLGIIIIILRMISLQYNWRLPIRNLDKSIS